MNISNFNSEEYEIMINKEFDNKLECYNHYLENSKDKFNEIEKLRVFSKNVSEFLTKLTDKKIYSNEDIYRNLENCLYNRKACVLSCGNNLNEHNEKFNEFKNYPEFTICCWKSSVNFFENISDVDIVGLGDHINNTNNYLDKIDNNFKVLFSDYEYITKNILKVKNKFVDPPRFLNKNDKFYMENNELYINNLSDIGLYKFIIFLSFLGFKEFYFFGMYLDTTWLDIRNYNYYDDILCKIGHYYDKEKKTTELSHYNPWDLTKFRTKEPGAFYDQANSYYLKDWGDFNKVALYNVSKEGCFSNRIPRISFDSIFKNKKEIVESNHKYEDFVTQYDKYVDKDYLKEKFKINNIHNYIKHIYIIPPLNKDDKRFLPLNNMALQIINLVPYIFRYPYFKDKNNYDYCEIFFLLLVLSFNRAFNLCFYKDFKKISNEEFWDNLLRDKESEIKEKLPNERCEEYKNTFFNKNKYFKLFLYMFFYNN